MNYYHIKYGNRLYLAVEDIHNVLWTNDMNKAITFLNLDDASEVLDQIKKDTGLYEASIVLESEDSIVVDNVP